MLYFIASFLLIAVGAAMLAKPQFFYELTESWKHEGGVGEPSKLYLFSTRFGGVMFILAGIFGLLAPLLS